MLLPEKHFLLYVQGRLLLRNAVCSSQEHPRYQWNKEGKSLRREPKRNSGIGTQVHPALTLRSLRKLEAFIVQKLSAFTTARETVGPLLFSINSSLMPSLSDKAKLHCTKRGLAGGCFWRSCSVETFSASLLPQPLFHLRWGIKEQESLKKGFSVANSLRIGFTVQDSFPTT